MPSIVVLLSLYILKPSSAMFNLYFCLILAQSALSFGSEAWTIRKQDINRLTACGMKFM
jgi:hypothetical protein